MENITLIFEKFVDYYTFFKSSFEFIVSLILIIKDLRNRNASKKEES